MRARALATESDGGAIGNVFGGWRPVALVGRGGTAEVWRAIDDEGREAALKILKPELRRHAGASKILRHEYELLRTVASPHLVVPLGLVEHDGTPALALEYLGQGDLVPLLGGHPRHWLPAFRTVLAALGDLHRRGIAHGDVKARNVLFAPDGRARVVDLTSARPLSAPASRTTAAYSTPAHAQPRGRDADYFAVAALLYELLTGRLPFGAEGQQRLPLEPPTVPCTDPGAEQLLAAAMAALRAGGRVGQGLSYFADVIESVDAAYG